VLKPLPARDPLTDFPFQYNIGIAVRRRDKVFRDSLQAVLDRKRPEIEAILKEYGVPVLPIEQGAPGKSTGAASAPADTGKKGSD
jgi:hypothetical protein